MKKLNKRNVGFGDIDYMGVLQATPPVVLTVSSMSLIYLI